MYWRMIKYTYIQNKINNNIWLLLNINVDFPIIFAYFLVSSNFFQIKGNPLKQKAVVILLRIHSLCFKPLRRDSKSTNAETSERPCTRVTRPVSGLHFYNTLTLSFSNSVLWKPLYESTRTRRMIILILYYS